MREWGNRVYGESGQDNKEGTGDFQCIRNIRFKIEWEYGFYIFRVFY